jgi:hypothetical protein
MTLGHSFAYAASNLSCILVTELVAEIRITVQQGSTVVVTESFQTPPPKKWGEIRAELKRLKHDGVLRDGANNIMTESDTLEPGNYTLHCLQPVTGGQVGSPGKYLVMRECGVCVALPWTPWSCTVVTC